jgi:hypothetical protein
VRVLVRIRRDLQTAAYCFYYYFFYVEKYHCFYKRLQGTLLIQPIILENRPNSFQFPNSATNIPPANSRQGKHATASARKRLDSGLTIEKTTKHLIFKKIT